MKTQRSRSRSQSRSLAARTAGVALTIGASVALFGAQGCLTRPVVPITPGSGGVVATKIRVTRIDKVDLLLMIDNSQSMGDKQSEVGKRIPLLIKELTAPGDPKIKGVNDLHVGVISSSLGSYGTSACDPTNPHNNDHGHLLKRPGDTISGTGWVQPSDTGEPTSAPCPGGIADASPISWTLGGDTNAAQAAASCVVQSVKEDGCGYENQLESAYHFLIDPDPWQDAKVDCTLGPSGDNCGTNKINVTGVDADLLAERKAFLRTDSLLAVLMVTDENDASLKPAQLNWLPWAYAKGQMQRGWDGCAKVPDDFEPDSSDEFNTLHTTYNCQSCFESTSNPNCSVPWATGGPNLDTDDRNMRAFEQTQRFGYNFLWGRKRYVDGFTASIVPGVDGSGNVVGKGNPIFAGGIRTKDLVIVAGILGVPLDLVQNTDLTPKALTEQDWQKIISPDLTVRDSRMIESIAPRAGRPKYKGGGDLSADPPTAPKYGNGGERDVQDGGDLQYACIAQRSTTTASYDCVTDTDFNSNPLCTPSKTQPYFKGYPGLRELRVIHDLGASGFAASICNNTYAPAIQGIIDKLQAALNAQCFKTILNADSSGRVNCLIEEVFSGPTNPGGAGVPTGKSHCEDIGPGYCTPGAAPCRIDGSDYPPVDPATAAAQLDLPVTVVAADGTATTQHCLAYSDGTNVYVGGDPANPNCGDTKHLICEDRQINDNNACLTDPTFTDTTKPGDPASGWCYTQDATVVGPACLKQGDPATIRFAGTVQPENNSEVFTLCQNNNLPTTPSASASP